MVSSRIFRDEEKFSDQVARGVAGAIDDIRHKVIEEGWFGRQTTDAIELVDHAASRAAEREKGVEAFYGLDRSAEEKLVPEPPAPPAPERSWDRDEGMER